MINVKLAGIGLVSALGCGIEANIQSLQLMAKPFSYKKLSQFNEPLETPYFAIQQPTSLNTEQSFYSMIDSAVAEALKNANLTDDELVAMPIFTGSSSYDISIAEAHYQATLASDNEAVPVLQSGYERINRHIQQNYGIKAADFSYNTACSSSANALLAAVKAIRSGLYEKAIVIGLEKFNITTIAGFHSLQMLINEEMRPFDKERSGMMLGEGCGAIVLRAATTEENGLFLRGGASNCDTYSISASNPDGSMIAAVMQEALHDTGLNTNDIVAIKAHGTATKDSDKGEAAGMNRVFSQIPPFFSLKPNIGHTLGGSGVIETALMASAIQSGFIPASCGFSQQDETLGISPSRNMLKSQKGHYMLNFFGFGGNNNSMILTY